MTKNNAVEKMFTAISLQREAALKMREAEEVLRDGPASYYEEKMREYVSALFDRFAPFKAGDRVRLVATPECRGGWASHKHTLIVGREGTVTGVDYRNGLFVASVTVDDQTFFDQDGNELPIKNPYSFSLSERIISKVDKP